MPTTEVSLSSKHQIVVPRAAREALGLAPGDKLVIVTLGKQVILMRKPDSYAEATKGVAEGVYDENYVDKERDSWQK